MWSDAAETIHVTVHPSSHREAIQLTYHINKNESYCQHNIIFSKNKGIYFG
jgi:hypothetical protein